MTRANPEQAAITWLESLPAIGDECAANLPKSLASATAGYRVVVSSVGGFTQVDYPVRQSAIQLDSWAWLNPETPTPDWATAWAKMEAIVAATEAFTPVSLTPTSWTGLDDVVIMQATRVGDPRRIRDDERNLARISMDVELTWR